jgi:hypothetical protein
LGFSRVARSALLATLLLLAGAATARAADPPVVEGSWVTDVTATSANLRARINPKGLPTTYRFEYVTQAAFEASGFAGAAFAPPSGAGALGAGTEPIAVVQHLSSLVPTTTYRYRLRVTNGSTVFGDERTLTTEVPSNVFNLPDGRAWELVSPVDKEGGAIAAPESLFGGGAFQAAAGGDSITYSSPFSFAGGAGALGASQYLSTRGPGGWATQNITTPMVSGSYGDEADGTPYRVFSGDLAAALLSNGVRCRSVGTQCPVANPPLPGTGAAAGYRNYYLRGADGSFQALLTPADTPAITLGPDEFELALAGTTSDLGHVLLSSCAKLTAAATEAPAPGGCDESEQNLYEWSGGGLSLVNLLPGDSLGTPGAVLAAPTGAISGDGSRVYFTMLGDGAIYLREDNTTKLLPETAGGASFQAASGDGAIAFFTKADHLYRYDDASETAEDLTPAGGVKGVLGASADGAYAYFQGAAGLEQWHEGATTVVAPGSSATLASDYPPATGTARLSADGKTLAFLSAAELTGYDNTDVVSGARDTELYLYRELPGGSALICASCNPTGERPAGSASIPGAAANGTTTVYKPRALTAGGNRLYFDSADQLTFTDTDSAADVYQWEAQGTGSCASAPGCLDLISEAREGGASFLDASASGDDVFFLTGESSVASDPGSIDVYDAKVGGGVAEPAKAFTCLGDACQALPSPPDDPTPGTLVPNAGNPPLQVKKQKPRRHKRKHRKHKHHPRRAGR